MICRTLHQQQLPYVTFDPTNKEHLDAFRSLCLGEKTPVGYLQIKQHPTLRFLLEENFPDVRSMMFHRVGEYHHKQHTSKPL